MDALILESFYFSSVSNVTTKIFPMWLVSIAVKESLIPCLEMAMT